MKNKMREILIGKGNAFNGLIALTIVGLFILGCNCNKLGDLGKKNDNPTNTSNPTNTGTVPTKTEPTYTKADASKKELPSDPEMRDMVKTSLLDFNSGVQTQNFTNFHSTVSKILQKQSSPQQMKEKFQMFIDGKMDISSISSMQATFTTPAKITKLGNISALDVKGEYPTSGIKTTFELQYIPEGKDWKLIMIKVYAPIRK